MDEQNRISPNDHEPGTVPAQPEATPAIRTSKPMMYIIGGIILVIVLLNLGNLVHGGAKEAPKSALLIGPTSPNAQQVTSFEAQQRLLAQRDEAERIRQQQLAAQMALLQQEQAVPGPESASAAPMTEAQRRAIYGDSPNAPKNTSNISQAQAEAKQKALAIEKQHQDALNSDTVAIDFARSGAGTPNVVSETAANVPPTVPTPGAAAEAAQVGQQPEPTLHSVSAQQPATKDSMAAYDFDGYQGRLYRVFEGTVFEGVVTNHIDGGFNGPLIVMLTTDYYSHDHQQLLLPQGTRLIGNVQSVGSSQQRKLFVVFNRAVCPDGFSIDLNKYTGLDPLGTTGLATNVNNHILSSFAAAAAIGGLGGLAQIGNNGSVLTADTQIRNGISAQTAMEGEQILNHFLNRLPVITVKEGSRARVYINQDILIPSYAEHRVDSAL
ncbi:TrbI/VirB10 family protein [Edaphobacter aggregans]|uniref:TrbI/VirB10 family protein n=1 Tax=Edaphobacter aggregans TaxID=570835 RepID=UPI000556127A|nr:TrbI/VirB10 family protein [Edaphobacter aggregans]